MDQILKSSVPVPPRGSHPVQVDEKGRLKLPALYNEFLIGLGEKSVFITTLDESSARIYTNAAWAVNAEFFTNPGPEEAQWAEDVGLIANHYGLDCPVDSQGRLSLPQALRKRLGMENTKVVMIQDKTAIAVYTEAAYEARLAKAREGLADSVSGLRRSSKIQ